MESTTTRRQFLVMAGSAAPPVPGMSWPAAEPNHRPKVAAVFTEFTYRSHAHVILENFLEPYLFNGKKTDPGMEVVSLYVDQFPAHDMAREVAREYKIPIFPTI